MHGCQGEVGRCEEAGPYSVEEHKFGDTVVFVDAEDCRLLAYGGLLVDRGERKGERTVDYETEDGDAEENLDGPDWVYPGNFGGHYRRVVAARGLSAWDSSSGVLL